MITIIILMFDWENFHSNTNQKTFWSHECLIDQPCKGYRFDPQKTHIQKKMYKSFWIKASPKHVTVHLSRKMRWETLASHAKAKFFFIFSAWTKAEYEGWVKLRLHPAVLPTTPDPHKPTEAINQRVRSKPTGHDRWAFIHFMIQTRSPHYKAKRFMEVKIILGVY